MGLEQAGDFAVFVHVDLLGGGDPGQAGHGHDIPGEGDDEAGAGAHLQVANGDLKALGGPQQGGVVGEGVLGLGHANRHIPEAEGFQLGDFFLSRRFEDDAIGMIDTLCDSFDFFFNGKAIGTWTSPGDFGDRKGKYTPSWWTLGSEYGLKKTLRLTETGVYMEQERIADIRLSDLLKAREEKDVLRFRIESRADAKHPGGLNLFGRQFGDYDQDIQVRFLRKE